MKLIVPMAGRGTRLRPHTHVTPKPLLPVLGRSMVERIVETISGALPRDLEGAVFVLGPDFGEEVREQLRGICDKHGIKARFTVQERALGTAHAVVQAGDHLSGECMLVFADTLFEMGDPPDFDDSDAIVWTKTVEDPSRFGVAVKTGDAITEFVEKPSEPISNEAIVGIYYVKEGRRLREAIDHLIDKDRRGHGGEYQLTDALDAMLKDGQHFTTASVTEWLDCGTIPALKETTRTLLEKSGTVDKGATREEAQIAGPVYLGPGVTIRRSEVGPNVSVEAGAVIEDSAIHNSIVFGEAAIASSTVEDSVVGHHAQIHDASGSFNLGDHSTVEGKAT